ncbi:iron chelate uptake ABC transporter family permease subunit [Phaeobacter inhibens]|uniref:iron chelate uptake ABC transporter family permease subunit n=1 Tax=Phaeobacter inhibens TaxID=221822 RepID=UPI000C9AF4CF|nr:metal ABC transporter permease [Phaeobacter inhibens]AUQ60650.1 high-affinity zinc uptake system membrane protein ZnuB [Phaeobacter inhibens]AUQ64730.1 high-affinity zinc uptake system membrane protein ZnuB [Phaeobacter inhibens]AUQ84568.1 high-affinity zinc uptake system membrane protein ZnuB [Phaeobacter inhibens]AUQ92377.1 high-affinity zinc uptake system membrane protein ZnuB [Phaeobacter inhibens]AUR09904.1 high-affinity zinc uptake system membrane protein ZnuB [Phaeobacter inhibens]
MMILDSFLIRAALAGVGVAIAAAPLGCFVVWRRMAYFGDATAHASILGIALALSFDTSIFVGVLATALIMATVVSTLSGRGYAVDTLLGVLAHSSLAFGLVAVSFLQGVRLDLMAYLFGDILAVNANDLMVIWGGALLVVGLLWWRWSALLTATLNPDLAHAAGIDPRREQLVLTLALAVVVAVAIKVVGVLLIAALLIIPAATARPFAATPERMTIIAAVTGAISALGGLQLAFMFDTPTGPTIVCLAACLFALSSLKQLLSKT